ncbi:uncharacterized protein G2W53_035108 [Senna tora]|uniref:Uncharacterized protein n=1 Tax=Senna tora TaxID=362788 RepID=A0A834SSY5_9FABA|nr:uncharacterized protein G2W53_035108 [Senna tora]
MIAERCSERAQKTVDLGSRSDRSSAWRRTRPGEQIGNDDKTTAERQRHDNTTAERRSERAEKRQIWAAKVTLAALGGARQCRNRVAVLNDPRTADLWQSSPAPHKTGTTDGISPTRPTATTGPPPHSCQSHHLTRITASHCSSLFTLHATT